MKNNKNSCCYSKNEKHKNNNSPIPDDGTFISPSNSSFSQEGTVRYGEEADADDL